MSSYKDINEFRERAGYEIDGLWYPRVTAILGIKTKAALYRYYASQSSYAKAQAITNQSAQEGTLVHNTIEAILKNEPVEIPEKIRPSVDAFLEFCRNNDVSPLKIEERIVSKEHRYAGTIDILAEVNGKMGVLDIKTSKGIYRDYGMQTAAYVKALGEDPNMPELTSWVLRLDQAQKCLICGASMRKKGGNHKIRDESYFCVHNWAETQGEYEFQEMTGYEHNIKAFLAAKTLWEWEHDDWLGQIV